MRKILLIDASSSWVLSAPHLLHFETVTPPIGLLSLAAAVKQKFGAGVTLKVINRIIDCRTPEELIAILKSFGPDIVGIRGVAVSNKVFHDTAAIVKTFNPAVTLIGGGPYPADSPEAHNDKNIDYIVAGEGELTFNELLETIFSEQIPSAVKGVIWKDSGRSVTNPPRELIQDLDSLPYPDYGMIDLEKYRDFLSWPFTRRRQIPVFSSRGCPYRCIYCHHQFGKQFRARSAANVAQEIISAEKQHGVKDFYFIDDAFNLDYDRAMEIFDRLNKSGIKPNLYFVNGIRGDIADRRFIDKMVEAGTMWVTYALETGSPRLQKYIKKNINLDKLAENIDYTCSKDIITNCFFMMGFPTETPDEAALTIDYISQFKKMVIPYFHAVRPYPGTEIYDMALREGFSEAKMQLAALDSYHNITHTETPTIPETEFKRLFFRFLNEVFLSKERLKNAIRIQRLHLTENEMLDTYSSFFKKRIQNIEQDVLSKAT